MPNIRPALIAHLSRYFSLGSHLGKLTRFPNIMRKRFFAIDMLAKFHCRHGDISVPVVRGGTQNGVNVLFLLKQYAKIIIIAAFILGIGRLIMFLNELLSRGPPTEPPVVGLFVIGRCCWVSDRHNLHIFKLQKLLDVRCSLSAATDNRDIYFFAGRDISRATKNVPGNDREGGGCAGGVS